MKMHSCDEKALSKLQHGEKSGQCTMPWQDMQHHSTKKNNVA